MQKLLAVLAMELDAEREVRVKNEDFCSMFERIREDKKVTCVSPRGVKRFYLTGN